MASILLLIFFFLLLASSPFGGGAQAQQSFTPPDIYLVKCGEMQPNLSIAGRVWQGDDNPATLISFPRSSSVAASISDSPIPLLNTSRIFTQEATYSFPVTPGRHWLRLYFHAFSYQNFTSAAATFSVTAAHYTLLHDFNPTKSGLLSSPNSIGNYSGFVFKEFNINFADSTALVTFRPSSSMSSYAFVNAIELISAPSDLVTDDTFPLGVNSPTPIGISAKAMETLYRINVGGPLVSPINDTTGLYRTWMSNETLLYSTLGVTEINSSLTSITYQPGSSQVTAPPIVYSTALQIQNPQGVDTLGFNLSWNFKIDGNYSYIVRFHLCDLEYSTGGKRNFNLYLENQTAFSQLDLGQDYGQYSAIHIDFYVPTTVDPYLWVQAGPAPNVGSVVFSNAIMNGIEVWKLSDSEDSLDGTALEGTPDTHRLSVAAIVGGAIGAAVAVAFVVMMICCCCRQRAKVVKQPPTTWVPLSVHGGHSASVISKTTLASGVGSYASSAPSSMGRVFAFSDIVEATHNFDEERLIGVGGFGKVYKGILDDGTTVAVKRGNPRSEQGIVEFRTEIDMLSKLRHRHLVSLIGYCKENDEMILVYEFMANGPLRSHLYGTNMPPLSWKQRLEVCVGAARGLHYLHTGATQLIIHRDVKTTNILLDENLVAKVSDFGLSKTGPALDQTHVSTAVKGSFGYLDPEYFRRQQLTEKSDVYSFGVVLMEVICARPAINPALPREQVNIAEWAMHWQHKGMLDHIMDPHLVGTVDVDSLAIFGKTAEKCLAEEGLQRPGMGQVLWNLEYALQLQDRSTARNSVTEERADKVMETPMLHPIEEKWEQTTELNHSFLGVEDETENITMSAVFSQMVRPTNEK